MKPARGTPVQGPARPESKVTVPVPRAPHQVVAQEGVRAPVLLELPHVRRRLAVVPPRTCRTRWQLRAAKFVKAVLRAVKFYVSRE